MEIPYEENPLAYTGNSFAVGSFVIYGKGGEKSSVINLNTAENLDYVFCSRKDVYIPRGITFAGCKSANYAFLNGQNVIFSEDATFERCESFIDAFNGANFELPENLKFNSAKVLDGCFHDYSKSTKYANHTYPNATDMSAFFAACRGVTTVNITAPKLVNANGFCAHCRSLKEITLNAPNLTSAGDGAGQSSFGSRVGSWGFCGNSTIEKLTIIQDEDNPKLSSIGCFAESCTNLREVDVNFGALTTMYNTAFGGTKLNYASVYRIASTLPSNASSKGFGTLGIDKTLQSDTATLDAIQMIRDKNWTVTPQWN